MSHRILQQGFTAVELLVTLFVAAAFIIAGYQLFNVVIQDGGETRAKVTAANTAYAYLRQYSDAATNPCTPTTPLTNSPITVQDLIQVTISVSIECPQTDAPTLSKVNAIITYNKNPQQTLTYSTYVDKSKGATTNTDVTDGLVGWWKLNGNLASSVGAATGTQSGGVVAVNGQNNTPNGAYSFNGTDGYIAIPGTWGGSSWSATTVSAWYKGTATNGSFQALVQPVDANFIHLSLSASGNNAVYVNSGSILTPISAQSVGAWHHAVIATQSGSTSYYLDGVKIGSTIATTYTNLTATTSLQFGRGFGSSRYFNGTLDDIRIYNRALSGSEVLQLYNGGAK